MATLEEATTRYVGPRLAGLWSLRRPGHVILDMGYLFAERPDLSALDLSRRSAIELSSGKDAAFMPPIEHDPEVSHHEYTTTTDRLPAKQLPATTMILSHLTRFIHGLADTQEFTFSDSEASLESRIGLAQWAPTHIELDRYSSSRDVIGNKLPQDYRRGRQLGTFVAAMVQLNGSRQFDIKYDNASRSAPLLLPGQVAVFRAPGLLDDAEAPIADFRFSEVFASRNNLTMTVMNHTVEPPAAS